MQVLFKATNAEATPHRELAVSRVRFVFRRLSQLIPRATVQLSDLNGPRGGVDKRCRVHLQTDGNGAVVVEAVAADWRSAIDQALARAARFLLRRGGRGQAVRRKRQPLLPEAIT